MADGPAGLRLAQKFYRDESGAHAVGNSAIPVGTAIAQSFNEELAEKYGDINCCSYYPRCSKASRID